MEQYERNRIEQLLMTLEDRNSALGTYFRSISKDAIKEIFNKESAEFLQSGIDELLHLEDYEICAAFRELMDEAAVNLSSPRKICSTTN